jgi:transposase
MVHLTESCGDSRPHLITHVDTTEATTHEARRTEAIHDQLAGKDLAPSEHLADAAYVGAGILLSSKEDHNIQLIGPARPAPSWQARVEGGYTADQFEIDWIEKKATCPEGKESSSWGKVMVEPLVEDVSEL